MSPADYQRAAARTMVDLSARSVSGTDLSLVWNAIGLAGEAGEVSELVKKGVLHQHGLDPKVLAKELGDVLWYVAALASAAGLSLDGIMAANIAKLQTRYPEGFTSADSVARVDVAVRQPLAAWNPGPEDPSEWFLPWVGGTWVSSGLLKPKGDGWWGEYWQPAPGDVMKGEWIAVPTGGLDRDAAMVAVEDAVHAAGLLLPEDGAVFAEGVL